MNKETTPESLAIRNELLLSQAKDIRFIKAQRIARPTKMDITYKESPFLNIPGAYTATLTAIGACGLKAKTLFLMLQLMYSTPNVLPPSPSSASNNYKSLSCNGAGYRTRHSSPS